MSINLTQEKGKRIFKYHNHERNTVHTPTVKGNTNEQTTSSWLWLKMNFRTSNQDIAGNGIDIYSHMSIRLVDDTPGRTRVDGMHNNPIYCHQPEHLKHRCPR